MGVFRPSLLHPDMPHSTIVVSIRMEDFMPSPPTPALPRKRGREFIACSGKGDGRRVALRGGCLIA